MDNNDDFYTPPNSDLHGEPSSEPPPSASMPSDFSAPNNISELLSTFVDFYPKLLAPLISVSLPLGLIYALQEGFNALIAPDAGLLLSLLIGVITFLAGTYFWCVAVHQVDDIFRGGDGEQTPWDRGTARFIPILITLFIVFIVSGVGLIMCIIPGVVALFFLLVAEFPVVLENKKPIDGLKRSTELIKNDLGFTFGAYMLLGSAGIVLAFSLAALLMLIGQPLDAESQQLMIATLMVPLIIFLYPAGMAINYLLYQGLLAREAERHHQEPAAPAPTPHHDDDPPAY